MSALKQSLLKLMDREDLTFTETEEVMTEIMTGQCTDSQIAGWLIAMNMKGETADEIAASIKVMRHACVNIPCSDSQAIDIVGTGGDGFGTYNISTASVFVAAGAGVTVAKHGNRALSSKSGSADVLSSLGINTACSAEVMTSCLEEINVSFMFAPLLHPAMKYAIGPRRELGVRTIFNLLGPMTNPAEVTRGVLGVFNEHYCRLLAAAGAKLGVDHMLFVHGRDGLDELTLTDKSLVIEVKGSEITEYELDATELGLSSCTMDDLLGGTPEENAEAVHEIFAGKKNAYRDAVILNAAAGIYTAGKTENLKDAVALATEAIDSGRAAEKLEALVAATQ